MEFVAVSATPHRGRNWLQLELRNTPKTVTLETLSEGARTQIIGF